MIDWTRIWTGGHARTQRNKPVRATRQRSRSTDRVTQGQCALPELSLKLWETKRYQLEKHLVNLNMARVLENTDVWGYLDPHIFPYWRILMFTSCVYLSICLSIYHINKNSSSIIICYSSIYLYLNFTMRTVQKLCFGKLWVIYRNPKHCSTDYP
jgi:hypothetical protein